MISFLIPSPISVAIGFSCIVIDLRLSKDLRLLNSSNFSIKLALRLRWCNFGKFGISVKTIILFALRCKVCNSGNWFKCPIEIIEFYAAQIYLSFNKF